MKGERDYKDFLVDISEAIENIENFVKNTDFEKIWATVNRDLVPLKEAVSKIAKTL